ncbi:MAG: hypothetical protein SOZ89_05640 [Peptoniphilaceae bacterium]|nr:hypothetical protein [Peptoniphilaceae bacterium]MDY3738587.1 hypothetical protein [Peptoniphilaceae bacterium]
MESLNNVYDDQNEAQQNTAAQENIRNRPKLIISSYSVDPQMVEAGSSFNMNMTFYNTNNTNTIYNLRITVDAQGSFQSQANDKEAQSDTISQSSGVFVPLNSVNTFYNAELYPWNTVSKTASLKVIPGAKSGSYPININMEYEDYWGNQYKDTQSVSVAVVQESQIKFSDINLPKTIPEGEAQNISLDVYNTGKSDLSNVMLKVEGKDFDVDTDSYFIGDFKSASQDTFSFNITPQKTGKINGKVVVTYTDSEGEESKEELKFNTKVEKSEAVFDENGNEIDPKTGQLVEKPQEGGFSTTGIIFSGILVVLVIALVIVFIKKRKAKKDEDLTLDE